MGCVVMRCDVMWRCVVMRCIMRYISSYMVPTAPGYSIEMHDTSVRDFTYPSGTQWVKRAHAKFETDAKIDVVT